MTYLVLARKWRPRSFETLVGQEHVVRALTHALTTQRLHHAWLFTGTRGVGKTTLSRILAKSLNCETGITPTPCGVCRACTEIDSGRFVDYLELDAASNRGVDEMTQLLEQAVYSPTLGRFKVYMIDEVHMLSGHAFNAMLKTLEEPPPHVKFILATTDPQKIPVTVLSRCLQFNLKQMPPESIVGHLDHVLRDEQMPFESSALRLIGQAARGSMRDALSLTDQAIAYSAGNLSEEAVRGMLGTIDQRHLVRLLDAVAAADGPGVVAVADELSLRSLSYSGALADLAVMLSRIALTQRVSGTVNSDDPMAEDIVRLAATLSPDQIQLFYSIAVHSRAELALAPDEYAGFVMACLRMLAFTAEPGAEPLPMAKPPVRTAPLRAPAPVQTATPVTRPAAVAPAVSPAAAALAAAAAASSPARAATVAPVAAPRPAVAPIRPVAAVVAAAEPVVARPVAAVSPAVPVERAAPVTPVSTPAPVEIDPMEAWASQSEYDDYPSQASAPAPAARPAAAPVRPQVVPAAQPPARPQVAASAPVSRVPAAAPMAAPERPSAASLRPTAVEQPAITTPAAEPEAISEHTGGAIELAEPWAALAARLPLRGLAAQLAQQSEWVTVDGATIVLRVATRTLSEGAGVDRLRGVLETHFGQPVRLRFEIGKTGDNTAHAAAQSERQARQEAAEQTIMADPFVRDLLDNFGGTIVPDSIRPATTESLQGKQS